MQTQFNQGPRAVLRKVPWWHRLGYIQRKLPQAIGSAMADLRMTSTSSVLDYGCADQPYRTWIPADATYIGADLPGNPEANLYIRSDGTLDVEDASFDAILSTQVLEHVADPVTYVAECYRVLRPGGRLLLSTHGIMVYHPDPVDYWRWTGAGLRRQVEEAGFRVCSLTGVMGLTATGLQLFQDGLRSRLPRLLRPAFTALVQALIAFMDQFDSPRSLAQNALVFIVIAEKPPSADGKSAEPPSAVSTG
jgi:SAM-dependent methyltransferase